MKLKSINQQVVVVVGASSGIGRAAAILFAARGARVVIAARNEKGLREVVEQIEARGGKAIYVVADVARVSDVKRVADAAIAAYGRIDTWAHVSATMVYATFEETLPNEMERVIEVNLLGQMYGALAALPHLRAAGGGALIHVSSVEGVVALPFNSAYAASKHGMNGFLDSLRLELDREGAPIAVVNIMPSTINTPVYESALTRLGVEPHAPQPIYEPEIVARAIVDAAERPQPEIIVGGGGAALIALKRFAPRIAHELLLGRIGFEAQLTRTPKSPEAPNNLFSPTPDNNLRIHGNYSAIALRSSLYTRLATSRITRTLGAITMPFMRIAARVIEAVWALRFAREGLPPPVVMAPAPKPEAEITTQPREVAPRTRSVGGRASQAAQRSRVKAKTVKRTRAQRTKP